MGFWQNCWSEEESWNEQQQYMLWTKMWKMEGTLEMKVLLVLYICCEEQTKNCDILQGKCQRINPLVKELLTQYLGNQGNWCWWKEEKGRLPHTRTLTPMSYDCQSWKLDKLKWAIAGLESHEAACDVVVFNIWQTGTCVCLNCCRLICEAQSVFLIKKFSRIQ
jgi:hypothetical protein